MAEEAARCQQTPCNRPGTHYFCPSDKEEDGRKLCEWHYKKAVQKLKDKEETCSSQS